MIEVKMFVTLDTLFDTRLTCLKKYNNDYVASTLKNGYFTRLTDRFSKCNKEIIDSDYENIYNTRDLNILRNSRMTNIVNFIKKEMVYFKTGQLEHPEVINIHLTINIWPFIIPNDELKGLCNILQNDMGVSKIMVMNKPLKDITPKFILDNFNTVVMYDFFNEWFEYYKVELTDGILRNVAFKVPLLLRKDFEGDDTFSIEEYSEACKYGFKSILCLELLPISDFCMHLPYDYNTDSINSG